MKLHIAAVSAAIMFCGGMASSAEAEMKGKNEISVQAGAMFFEGDANLDTGFVYGARFGHYFTERLSGEISLFPGKTKYNGTDVNTLYPAADASYHFRFGDFMPFVQAGAGMLRFKADGSDAQKDFAMHWGGGLKWFYNPDWLVRADVDHVIDLDSGTGTHNLMAVLGISWLFGGTKEEAAKPAQLAAAVQDSDKDGVPDPLDSCAGTPAGVQVDAKGCPADSDKDGVPDYKDACAATPAGAAVNKDGCPLDSDADGVTDDKDECPATPTGTKVDQKGCPLGTTSMPETQWILKGVTFEVNSDIITPEGKAILDEAVGILQPRSSVRLEIQGHTDNTGDKTYNQNLSEKRAEAVKAYLVSKNLSADRFETKGYGDTVPVADNATPEGRNLNRRIEFKVLSK